MSRTHVRTVLNPQSTIEKIFDVVLYISCFLNNSKKIHSIFHLLLFTVYDINFHNVSTRYIYISVLLKVSSQSF